MTTAFTVIGALFALIGAICVGVAATNGKVKGSSEKRFLGERVQDRVALVGNGFLIVGSALLLAAAVLAAQ